MQFSYNLFLVLHFIGISGLLGGLLAQIPNKQKQSQNIVLHSARLALIAGIGMVGLNQVMQSDDPTVEALNHIKIAVKSLIITLVYVIGYHSKKKVHLSNKMWGAMVGLTITNIFIAVLWG